MLFEIFLVVGVMVLILGTILTVASLLLGNDGVLCVGVILMIIGAVFASSAALLQPIMLGGNEL